MESENIIMRLVAKNPLAIGLVALVLGAIIGLLIPESDQENRLLGPKRDQFAQQATETARDLTHKAQAVAQSAAVAAHDVVDKTQEAAKEAISDAVGSIKEEAKNQGIPVPA